MKLKEKINNIMSNKYKRSIASTVMAITVLTVIITVCTIAVANRAMAWFSNNTEVSGSGMSVTASGVTIEVEMYDETMTSPLNINTYENGLSMDFTIPGSSEIRVFKITNKTSNKTIKIDKLYFYAPTSEDEVKKVYNNSNYWFSTQLYAKGYSFGKTQPSSASVSSCFEVEGEDPTDTELYGNVLFDGIGDNPGNFTIYEDNEVLQDIVLSYNESCYIAVKVTFKNDPNNSQNVYIDFGKGNNPDYYCKRKIGVNYTAGA